PPRHFPLIEAFPPHPVRASLEGQEAVLDVGQEVRKHLVVVVREVELRIAFVGPEHLVRVRDGKREPAGVCFDDFRLRHAVTATGITTSSGRLSSRSPRKAGCRSFRSAVHSSYAIWATRRGVR